MKKLIVALSVCCALLHIPAFAGVAEGLDALDKGDNATALREFRVPAEQGHRAAQFALGVLYLGGEGVPQDFKQAAAWFRKAAEQGEAGAQSNLGLSYAKGEGVTKNLVLAYALLNISAATKSSEQTVTNRAIVSAQLSSADIEAGQELSRKMAASGQLLEVIDQYVALRPFKGASR